MVWRTVWMVTKRLVYRFALFPVACVYWRLLRPKTYGVRLLVTDPATGQILLIRQCYGRRDLWTMPGGGYKPGLESAQEAAMREAYEETGVRVTNLRHLTEDVSDRLGNHDVRQIFTADLLRQDESASPEIEEMRWVVPVDAMGLNLARVAQVAFTAAYPKPAE